MLSGEAPLKSLSNEAAEVRGQTKIIALPDRPLCGIATLAAMAINAARRVSCLGEEDWWPEESEAMPRVQWTQGKPGSNPERIDSR